MSLLSYRPPPSVPSCEQSRVTCAPQVTREREPQSHPPLVTWLEPNLNGEFFFRPISMFHKYNNLLKRYPYRTNMVTTGILFGFGDSIAQHFFPHQNEDGSTDPYDFHRTLRSWTYGTFFMSPLSVFWYGKTLPKLTNPLVSKAARLTWSTKKINFADIVFRLGIDQLFVPGLIWIPMYNIVMTTLAMHEHPLDVAFEKLERNWWNVLKASWMVWPAFQVVSLTFIPVHLRTVSANVCSVGWNCFLSLVHNSKTHYKTKALEDIHDIDESAISY